MRIFGPHRKPEALTPFLPNRPATYARNRNKVTELPGANFVGFGVSGNSVIEGKPVGVFRSSDFVRFGCGSVVDGVEIDNEYSSWQIGDLYIADDGYPVVDPELRLIGDPNPDWTGSVRNSVTLFNNLTVSALLDIRKGGDVLNGTRGALYAIGTHKDTEDREGTRIFEGEGPGKGTPVPKGEEWYSSKGGFFSGAWTQFVEDGGYVKLRDIAASYTFRSGLVGRMGLSSIDVRVSAQNLKTWTDYTGVDPETNLFDSSNTRGFDYFNNPNTRSYVFTVQLNY